MNNAEKPVPLTMSAERLADLRKRCGTDTQDPLREIDALNAALAETREQLRLAKIDLDDYQDAQEGRDALQEQLAQAQARLKHLEMKGMDHLIWDDDFKFEDAIDAALRAKQEPPQSSVGPSKGEGL